MMKDQSPATPAADPSHVLDRRRFLGSLAASAVGWSCLPRLAAAAGAIVAPARRPNILFISVDDLRPELGCYGRSPIQSPHMDRLAAGGTLFERAYCNVPVCGPSRVSVLTGLRVGPRPWSTGGVDRDFITLPAHLKAQGYHAISNGKIFHHMRDSQDDWSEAPWRSEEIYHGKEDWAKYNTYGQWQNPDSGEHLHPRTGRGPYFEAADVPDNAYQDGKVADKSIADLRRLAAGDRPFFLACGFWRPHLPFNAPRKYWDLYDRDAIEPAPNRAAPEHLPPNLRSSTEIDGYALAGDRKQTEAFHREARHAYYASVSYVDAQIGRVLDALDELGVADNTIVALWGDHGWNLGEHGFWGKHNTFHNSLHSPLIVRAPGRGEGKTTRALVELVDLYPSLCELAGVPVPSHVEGASVAPLLDRPDRPWKSAAFAEWTGCHAVKTDRYLYTQWAGEEGEATRHMLFDHATDPEENRNIADDPDAAEAVAHHRELLRQGWKAALPAG